MPLLIFVAVPVASLLMGWVFARPYTPFVIRP